FLMATVFVSESAPLVADDAQKLEVLFINDFTLNFVADDEKSLQKAAKCPGNAYPTAAQQFDFTSAVVDAIDASIDLTLQYDFYNGGHGNHLSHVRFTREDFATAASHVFKNFCFEGPTASDLPIYVQNVLPFAQNVEVLVLFTAAPAAELAAALPIDDSDAAFKAVIVVGLNGTDAAAFYPDTSIIIPDFSKPETIACMINVAYSNIQQRKPAESPTKTCTKA
ncbi:hypothetical protein PENTCL1PPCAC_25999, partial [Pristionchus entomophagus]